LKLKEGFLLREVAGQWVVVPLGERVVEFNGIMTLSESGALLWGKLKEGTTEEELLQVLMAEYSVDEDIAKKDIQEFIQSIKDKGLIEA